MTLSNVGVVFTVVNSSFGSARTYAAPITFNGLGGETLHMAKSKEVEAIMPHEH